ncbi:hypothetical protein [Bordetella tumulicola]|uniref:hypothetical protein n=1 Tax=Bordetella tumulicola TaxID=1649133 RepID=UPI0039EEEDD2
MGNVRKPAQGTSSESSARPGTPRKTVRPESSADGKILPPRDVVDVPRQPAVPDARTPNEAAKDSRPVRDNQDESNWADGAKPKPHAKNARSHLL